MDIIKRVSAATDYVLRSLARLEHPVPPNTTFNPHFQVDTGEVSEQ